MGALVGASNCVARGQWDLGVLEPVPDAAELVSKCCAFEFALADEASPQELSHGKTFP